MLPVPCFQEKQFGKLFSHRHRVEMAQMERSGGQGCQGKEQTRLGGGSWPREGRLQGAGPGRDREGPVLAGPRP